MRRSYHAFTSCSTRPSMRMVVPSITAPTELETGFSLVWIEPDVHTKAITLGAMGVSVQQGPGRAPPAVTVTDALLREGALGITNMHVHLVLKGSENSLSGWTAPVVTHAPPATHQRNLPVPSTIALILQRHKLIFKGSQLLPEFAPLKTHWAVDSELLYHRVSHCSLTKSSAV